MIHLHLHSHLYTQNLSEEDKKCTLLYRCLVVWRHQSSIGQCDTVAIKCSNLVSFYWSISPPTLDIIHVMWCIMDDHFCSFPLKVTQCPAIEVHVHVFQCHTATDLCLHLCTTWQL